MQAVENKIHHLCTCTHSAHCTHRQTLRSVPRNPASAVRVEKRQHSPMGITPLEIPPYAHTGATQNTSDSSYGGGEMRRKCTRETTHSMVPRARTSRCGGLETWHPLHQAYLLVERGGIYLNFQSKFSSNPTSKGFPFYASLISVPDLPLFGARKLGARHPVAAVTLL